MTRPSRREFLGSALTLAAAAGLAGRGWAGSATGQGMTLGVATPFSAEMVDAKAKMLAGQPYADPVKVPQPWLDLTYDQYKLLNFNRDFALWKDQDKAARAEFFAAGLYFASPVIINAVEGPLSREVKFEMRTFTAGEKFPRLSDEGMGFSGFRLTGYIDDDGLDREYAVFQGASYFRAVARGQGYGMSSRGLAIGTGNPNGEEFPFFQEFWIEAAPADSPIVIVHALMNSPSTTGAYTFRIAKGAVTTIEVDARLFPRVDITEVGIAPGTSMFLFNQMNRQRFDDFRDGVYDSDGLLMLNGKGELLWRPLMNPLALESSAFSDENPRGFGLMQRSRSVADFQDLEARYELRPSLWVEPMEDWGKGEVRLIEIPSDKEIYDNIVAFWRPAQPIAAKTEARFKYRLHWCDQAPVEGPVARALNVRSGDRIFEEGRLFAIDYAPHPALGADPEQIEARVTVSTGTVSAAVVHANPLTGGMRLDFTVVAPEAPFYELRAELWRDGQRVSEVWLYRWINA